MTTSTTNGALAAAAAEAGPPATGASGQPGPRMPKRTLWVDLPATTPEGEVAYPGFRVRVWVNFPARIADQIKDGTEDDRRAALRQIVLEHNGWCDDEGTPFAPADDPAFYNALPQELASLIVVTVIEAMSRFPNSLLATRRSSAGT
jgi:hypothetical protein